MRSLMALLEMAPGNPRTMDLSDVVTASDTPAMQAWDLFDHVFERSGLKAHGHVALSERNAHALYVSHIGVKTGSRGEKLGSQMLDLLCACADRLNVVLYLAPANDADGETGLDRDALCDWYASRGFEHHQGETWRRAPERPSA